MATATELFSGAGGAGLGIAQAGVHVVVAANHLPQAVATYQDNHPATDVRCADISQVSPSAYPSTDLLWASPSCTHHSKAQGRRRASQPGLFDGPAAEDVAERSRATMWDVVRFAEYHRYRAILVENVVEVRDWVMWPAWRMALDLLGYRVRVLYLNAMHCAKAGTPTPQSRNRLIVLAVRAGERMPDLDRWLRPDVHCPDCDRTIAAVQSWKDPRRPYGVYGANGQYWWRCPTRGCHRILHPTTTPATAVLDLDDPGTRIGDRDRPLVPATLDRIRRDLTRLGTVDPSAPAAERHMLVPYYGQGRATLVTSPVPTVPTRDRFALVSRDSADVDGLTHRMLTVPELQAAMAFPTDYRLTGTGTVRKLMLGNAVPPPLARDPMAAVVEAITGEDIPQTTAA